MELFPKTRWDLHGHHNHFQNLCVIWLEWKRGTQFFIYRLLLLTDKTSNLSSGNSLVCKYFSLKFSHYLSREMLYKQSSSHLSFEENLRFGEGANKDFGRRVVRSLEIHFAVIGLLLNIFLRNFYSLWLSFKAQKSWCNWLEKFRSRHVARGHL